MQAQTIDERPDRILLTPPQGDDGRCDTLHALRVATREGDGDPDAFESRWQPDSGELKALVNGADVLLYVWGGGHPPVAVEVADPPDDGTITALLTRSHVDRALAKLGEDLAAAGLTDAQVESLPLAFERALAATAAKSQTPAETEPKGGDA